MAASFPEWIQYYNPAYQPVSQEQIFKLEHRLRDHSHIDKSLIKKWEEAQKMMNAEFKFSFLTQDGLPKPELKPRTGSFCQMEPEAGQKGPYHYGVAQIQGDRDHQEDAYLASDPFKITIGQEEKSVQIFGVFDGHSGSQQAANFSKENICKTFAEQISILQTTFPEFDPARNPVFNQDDLIWNAIKLTCVSLDDQYPGLAGTTFIGAIIIDDQLWIPNVGDSRAVIDQGGEIEALSTDMRAAKAVYPRDLKSPITPPNFNAPHTNRIFKRGGQISFWRRPDHYHAYINGQINLAGSIGDPTIPATSPRPDIIRKPLRNLPPNTYLYLGSDGLFDVLANTQVVATGRKYYAIQNPDERLTRIASACIGAAYNGDEANNVGGDNITSLIVQLA